MEKKKVELQVVVFEEVTGAGRSSGAFQSRTSPDQNRKPVKHPVIKPMILDVERVSAMGIRKWDNKEPNKNEDWAVLFDTLKDGENIIVAMSVADLKEKFELLGIIKIV